MKARIFEILTYLIFGTIVFVTTQKYFPKIILLPIERIDDVNISETDKAYKVGANDGLKFIYIYSYDCKYCYEMNNNIEKLFKKYNDKVSFYFLNKAKLDDKLIFEASIFSECMLNYEFENYFKANDFIYDKVLTNNLINFDYSISEEYWGENIKNEKVSECVSLQETFSSVHNNHKLVGSFEINETPAIIIDNKLLKGSISYNILDTVVENYLLP
ncbi:MAG: thioredoxin domain-containing protein [Gracilimonas sp.]|nr:thioredoxin domain-containing protein [Gracilimonas sp.]